MGKSWDASRITENKDPCWKESKLSMSCISDNGFDKSKCTLQFENYKSCKTFWMNVKFARRRQGLYPLVPETEAERNLFREKYRETGEIPARVD
ncbi:coiled-coil-helix-coiled-coil-helix domain-containing protein 7 [Eurytemora carolleeae]|uniref:coiled-coil-helix-coiled-coil-helix domain-containing protein 7 n=1 Tax=Eurytemora carolleeae TaxID=1294199 RepID=UPI000C77A7E0|nr:coiled-coil-helix-coiled-coil-helix domain-containing protein 7 [Eurytemora carolleeae]|eukprot:XP_023346379.1 coiled-coil-helix-coiled-coil-helix domain-containing protein 7-like [Eurytemora affinis]